MGSAVVESKRGRGGLTVSPAGVVLPHFVLVELAHARHELVLLLWGLVVIVEVCVALRDA